MIDLVLEALAVVALMVGLAATTVSLWGMLRLTDIYAQIHALALATGVGTVGVLIAAIGSGRMAIVTHAVLIGAFLTVTAPLSSHAIAQAAHRRRAAVSDEPTGRDDA